MFSNRSLGFTSNDQLTPYEERYFADKNADPHMKIFTEQLVCCAKYLKALKMAVQCETQEKFVYHNADVNTK